MIGPNAAQLEAGGGSSEVTPYLRRRLFDALADRLPGAAVVHQVGCRIEKELPTIDIRLVTPDGGGRGGSGTGSGTTGLTLDYFDNPDRRGSPVGREEAHMGRLTWVGSLGPDLPAGTSSVRIRALFTPDVSGLWRWGLESAGRASIGDSVA